LSPEAECAFEIPPPGDESGEEKPEEENVGLMASTTETLRHKRFEDCTPEELEAVRRLMARFRLPAQAEDPPDPAGVVPPLSGPAAHDPPGIADAGRDDRTVLARPARPAPQGRADPRRVRFDD